MNKIAALFVILILVLALVSCDGGSPPELYLSFFIDDWVQAGSTVSVDYTIENGGDTDLENCKIQFGVDTSADGTRNYSKTQWTDGVDLDEGESDSVNNFDITITGTAVDVYVIASGFDNPTEADKSARTTIIYYDE